MSAPATRDRNARRLLKEKLALIAGGPVFGIPVTLIPSWDRLTDGIDVHDIITVGTIWALTSFMMTSICMVSITGMTFMSSKRTPDMPKWADRDSVRRVIEALCDATRHGLASDRRMAVTRDLSRASDLLSYLCGKPVWIHAENSDEKADSTGLLALRGDALRRDGETLCDLLDRKHGADMLHFQAGLGKVVPLIASVARDFGLETFEFTASERALPGQIRGEATPIPQLAAPTVALADEWLSGSRGSVPDLLSIAADSAARQDLDELQRSWKTARLSAPDDEAAQRVDDTFGSALSNISRTLCEAIAARSAGDEQDLQIQGRYIESKHGNTAGDLVAS